jgi:hypothetical protein
VFVVDLDYPEFPIPQNLRFLVDLIADLFLLVIELFALAFFDEEFSPYEFEEPFVVDVVSEAEVVFCVGTGDLHDFVVGDAQVEFGLDLGDCLDGDFTEFEDGHHDFW